MKNIMFLMCSFIITNNVFSLDIKVISYDGIRITDNKLYFIAFDEESRDEEYDIAWETINKVQYISFNYTGNFLNSSRQTIPHGIKRYLVLYGDDEYAGGFIFLFDSDNKCVYAQYSRITGDRVTPTDVDIKASSELKEGNITYKADNMLDYSNLTPWVEGVQNAGIGQKISLKYNTATGGVANSMVSKLIFYAIAISNGFVDYKRPYLYENNNRIKKIRVHRIGENGYIDYELEDTPQIQIFRFDGYEAKEIEIEILEIYEGTRWNDTCINKLFPYQNFSYK